MDSNLMEVWDLEYLLWNAYQKIDKLEHTLELHDIEITDSNNVITKQIRTLRELKTMLEPFENKEIKIKVKEIKKQAIQNTKDDEYD